jgi:hypothetical protein
LSAQSVASRRAAFTRQIGGENRFPRPRGKSPLIAKKGIWRTKTMKVKIRLIYDRALHKVLKAASSSPSSQGSMQYQTEII